MIKNPFLGPKYFTNRFSCTNTKLNQVTIQFYAKIVARLLLKLGWDILPHICRIAAANPKWLPLCRGNWKVQQNDQYSLSTLFQKCLQFFVCLSTLFQKCQINLTNFYQSIASIQYLLCTIRYYTGHFAALFSCRGKAAIILDLLRQCGKYAAKIVFPIWGVI